MLIEFKVANYRSIGDEQILSFIPASKQKEHPENIIERGNYKALNALGIYGANASGKSNLLRSMNLLDRMLHLSARSGSTTKLPYDPFLLREGWAERPTRFEITFLAGAEKYRYGLEFTQNEVVSEWLHRKSVGREVVLFLREKETIEVTSAFKGSSKLFDAAVEATRPNALFLSFCDTFNIEEAKSIFQWFRHFYMIDGLKTEGEELHTVALWDSDTDSRKRIQAYLGRLKNLGIASIEVIKKDFDASDLPESISSETRNLLLAQLSGKTGYAVFANHRIYTADGQPTEHMVSWKMEEKESAGTNKIFQLLGPALRTLTHGGVLIIDEIEAKMHPLLTLDLLNFFLNPETNPNQAQVIFATHDTNLLSYSSLRRDQIYFADKNNWESTEVFSLSDFVYLGENGSLKERPDADKEKRYLEGRYRAVPVFENFELKMLRNPDGKTR